MMFIDSHAHIQLSQFNRDRDRVLQRAHEAAGLQYLGHRI